MLPDIQRTIVALASAPVAARRAIVRLTGPHTWQVLRHVILNADSTSCAQATRLTTCEVEVAGEPDVGPIPARLYYWPNQRSYTGQPSAELHLIGCVPLAEAVIAACCQAGAGPAERGEFTLRAFLNGKLDLAQAEAVLGVIEAQGEESLRAALTQLGGNLAPAVRPLRDAIVDVLARLEAGLDFVEEDIEFIDAHELTERLLGVRRALLEFSNRLQTRSSSSHAPRCVFVGAPNSGKSSLFNAIVGESRAIVDAAAGTTRDYLTHKIDLGALEIELVDTAGLEDISNSSPRGLAQRQTIQSLATADVRILCVDCSRELSDGLSQYFQHGAPLDQVGLVVGTKFDLPTASRERLEQVRQWLDLPEPAAIAVSAVSGLGIESLRQALKERLQSVPGAVEPLAVVHQTAVRCRVALEAGLEAIDNALALSSEAAGDELVAAELRLALDELSTIIGEVHSDAILGEIFSRFCIGK